MLDTTGLKYYTKKIHVNELVGIRKDNDFNIMASLVPDDFMAIQEIYENGKVSYYLTAVLLDKGRLPIFLFDATEYRMVILAHPKFLTLKEKANIFFVDKPVSLYHKEPDGLIGMTLDVPDNKFMDYEDAEVLGEMKNVEDLLVKFGMDFFFERAKNDLG